MTPRSRIKLRPWVIMHNTLTLDGSISGFMADFDIHYGVISNLNVQAYLIGSQTVLDAAEDISYATELQEEDTGFIADELKPYWVVVDSKGRLQDILHLFRKMKYIKEIIVLVSEKTPKRYIQFLKKHNYPFIRKGDDYVNYHAAFLRLKTDYNIRTLITDTGTSLNNFLIEKGLMDELSLIIAPLLLSKGEMKVFEGLQMNEKMKKLRFLGMSDEGSGYVWLRYLF